MSGPASADKPKNRLVGMTTEEVGLVDRAANRRRFLIVKNEDEDGMKTKLVPDGKGGFKTVVVSKADGAPAPGSKPEDGPTGNAGPGAAPADGAPANAPAPAEEQKAAPPPAADAKPPVPPAVAADAPSADAPASAPAAPGAKKPPMKKAVARSLAEKAKKMAEDAFGAAGEGDDEGLVPDDLTSALQEAIAGMLSLVGEEESGEQDPNSPGPVGKAAPKRMGKARLEKLKKVAEMQKASLDELIGLLSEFIDAELAEESSESGVSGAPADGVQKSDSELAGKLEAVTKSNSDLQGEITDIRSKLEKSEAENQGLRKQLGMPAARNSEPVEKSDPKPGKEFVWPEDLAEFAKKKG